MVLGRRRGGTARRGRRRGAEEGGGGGGGGGDDDDDLALTVTAEEEEEEEEEEAVGVAAAAPAAARPRRGPVAADRVDDGRQARGDLLRVVDTTPHPQAGWVTTVELRSRTGRRHQLRRHCAALGHPICGDDLYAAGGGAFAGKRALGLFLQSVVALPHPDGGGRTVRCEVAEAAKLRRQRERRAGGGLRREYGGGGGGGGARRGRRRRRGPPRAQPMHRVSERHG